MRPQQRALIPWDVGRQDPTLPIYCTIVMAKVATHTNASMTSPHAASENIVAMMNKRMYAITSRILYHSPSAYWTEVIIADASLMFQMRIACRANTTPRPMHTIIPVCTL